MTFLFNDKSFSFETLRALGYAPYGGADIGEVTSTASRIPMPTAVPPKVILSAPASPTCGQQLLPGVRVLPARRPSR